MSKERILWADDEIDLLKPHILVLENKGYEVETVTNGRDAIDMLSNQIFNLIILDENMPGISGLEALQRIKILQPNVPVIMITKSEEEDIMNQPSAAKSPTTSSSRSIPCRYCCPSRRTCTAKPSSTR